MPNVRPKYRVTADGVEQVRRTRRSAPQPTDVPQECWGYVRASTEEQETTRQDQAERIRLYAASRGFHLTGIIEDNGLSGASLADRPKALELLRGVEAGKVSCIIVTCVSRWSRNIADWANSAELTRKHGCSIIAIDESIDTATEQGKMISGFLSMFAQWEREKIQERTRNALSHKRRHGVAYGPTPFGFTRDGKTIKKNPTEFAILERMVQMRRSGATYDAISGWLTASNVKPRGKRWTYDSARTILNSKMTAEHFA